jgi:hypothetical protein
VNAAGAPPTLTDATESPAKSRSNRLRRCVATASMRTTPLTDCCGAAVGYALSLR